MLHMNQSDLENLRVPEVEEPVLFTVVFEQAEIWLRERSKTQEPNISEDRVSDCVGLLRQIYRRKFASIRPTRDVFVNLCSILKITISDQSTRETMYTAIKEVPAVCLMLHFYVPPAHHLVD
jgi:hypothetical protein